MYLLNASPFLLDCVMCLGIFLSLSFFAFETLTVMCLALIKLISLNCVCAALQT
ncbi:hypothetical protein HMPREF9370_0334 [Neisseria wadsworthii 9715]|uniref:Uncharacterized protein n=1 Tax=Neisseria wadsworthii 9715 TaxID=1030841 RepID=G4CMM5_9NEIS|nr:hypothetical protein HMPREF9370_0334 [Neisseria wadsworthii 9715]